jgi:hypothetical protein
MSYLDLMPVFKRRVEELGEDRIAFAMRRLARAKATAVPGTSGWVLFRAAKLKSDLWSHPSVRSFVEAA